MSPRKKSDDSLILPLIPLRGVTPFPGNTFTLDIGRETSVEAVRRGTEQTNGQVVLVAQRDAKIDVPAMKDLYGIGVIAVIRHVIALPNKTMRILVEGMKRCRIDVAVNDGEAYGASVRPMPDPAPGDSPELTAAARVMARLAKQLSEMRGNASTELLQAIEGEKNPLQKVYLTAANFINNELHRQNILEADETEHALELTLQYLGDEIGLFEIEQRIERRVQEAMDKANHEYYLREQINAINEELDQEDEDIADYRKKLAASRIGGEARDKVERELRRLSRAPLQSPEATVSQNYIEYMLEMPWGICDETTIDIAKARRVLDEDHYGLKDVKERLIEYLAVKKSAKDLRSPILCLVGPPGVGKTSIARSVARALGRKFTQVSLGGVHDEAEVRGHRKTYVGAMPGRIISSIKRAGTMNPVFLLDEIDKLSRDMHGDPSAALLEALDPEQNRMFKDHFIEAPVDLSEVLFITTANSTEPVNRALLDRMEVIELPGYTHEEKRAIALKHLLPKQLAAHGLAKGSVRVSEKVMDAIIEGYTREAGVRALERQIEKLCRRSALRFIEDPELSRITVRREDLHDLLGVARYQRTPVEREGAVGVVNGLAWTEVGGEVMPVEAVFLPGSGKLELTGKLGQVMQESAHLALSLTRMLAGRFGVEEDFFEKHDLHIHVPEGATPKDGPSAGVALTCAVLSAASGLPARGDIAMTGEVTLHGKVLPIGGVRDKLLAALRMGISDILLPEENFKDLEEIDEKLLAAMNITRISSVTQAIDIVLGERG